MASIVFSAEKAPRVCVSIHFEQLVCTSKFGASALDIIQTKPHLDSKLAQKRLMKKKIYETARISVFFRDQIRRTK